MAITLNGTTGITTPAIDSAGPLTAVGSSIINVGTDDNLRISQETHTAIGAVNDAANAFVELKVDGSSLLLNTQSVGNVGIGTSSPAAKLDVNSGDIAITSTQASDNGDLGEFQFWNTTNAGSGTGTSFVNDVAAIQGQMQGTGNNSGGSLHFYTKADGGSKTEQMAITGEGNVGIGTSSPNSKLTSQTASTSTSAFSFANQLNNSYGSNDSIVAMGFHNRADVNATGVGAAIALSGGSVSSGSGNLIFCIKDTSGIGNVVTPSDEKMRIDSLGRVTTPSQPSFRAGRTAGAVAAGTVIIFNEVKHNIGNCYNSGNGRFTAPVAGSYVLLVSIMDDTSSTGTNDGLQLRVNGNPVISSYMQKTVTGANAIRMVAPVVTYMAAGDYAEVVGYWTIYGNSSVHTSWSGHLVG